MRKVRLGRSGLDVSCIAFGTSQLGGDWGKTDENVAISAVRRAAELGVTLFDTALAYGFGAAESLLAKALSGYDRRSYVLATKGGLRPQGRGYARDSSREWILRGAEESLRALHTDYIDLYQVHWPDPAVPFEETAGALRELVEQGKVLHVGVSNFDAGEMESLSGWVTVETLQPPYHLFRRNIEGEILPYAASHDIGVLVYGPLSHGLLGGALSTETAFPPGDWRNGSVFFHGDSYSRNLQVVEGLKRFAYDELGVSVSQLAIAWTLAHPAVHVSIVGTRNPSHVEEMVKAGDVLLGEDALDRIEEIVTDAVPIGGPSPEAMREE